MLEVPQALELVLRHAARRPASVASLGPDCLGLVLAEDVISDLDMPPFDKSLMDGYAVRLDATTEQPLAVAEEVPAGYVPTQSVGAGQCVRIMTGAMIPSGAEAVVMIERTEAVGPDRVRLLERPGKAGQNILARGREMRNGEVILTAGTRLRPQECGLLACVGRTNVPVFARPVVSLVSTGDEIVEAAAKPAQGQIRNSNATMLACQIVRANAGVRYLGIARDHPDSLRALIREGLQSDMLVLSGGVSAGKLDLVPGILREQGVTPVFHQVRMKPGKPLFFGVRDSTLIFGLPGNPVSSLVGFELFVRPALRMMRGLSDPGPRTVRAELTSELTHRSDRPTYHPVQLAAYDARWQATLVPWFGSADLRSIGGANAFACLPAGEHRFAVGHLLEVVAPEEPD